ncbi:MAG: hypothetical protein RJQ10_05430 [Haliea sp.]|uniref:hypothetical protein n=1 Tax=Haliea sp. TaxID=1932666 RepID=UPI0032EF6CB7
MKKPCAMILATFLLLLLAACSSQEQRQPTANRVGVDFSGSWSLDYGQSDNIQVRLNGLVRELQRQAERRAQAGGGELRGPGAALMVGNAGTDSGASIVGLAQMADLVTRSQLLEVEQDPSQIRVRREGDFALDCDFHDGRPTVVETPLGSEFCGWDGHQLLFVLSLPEGLAIRHRLTLGPDGQMLNIATTVSSDRVSSPFTLNRVYRRMDPEAHGFSCEQTLTRGKVCTTESP